MSELSGKDIVLIRKKMKSATSVSIWLLIILIIVNIISIMKISDYQIPWVVLMNVIAVICIFAYYKNANRKYDKDLKSNEKMGIKKTVQKKEYKSKHQPSHLMLNSKVFSLIFPESGRKDLIDEKWILVIDDIKYLIDKTSYNLIKKGDPIELFYTMHSNTYLGLKF